MKKLTNDTVNDTITTYYTMVRFIEIHGFCMSYRYDEMCDYNFQESKSNSGKVTGHFTQLVWKPTKEFGIGYATGVDNHDPDMKCVYVVARYKPAGNIIGKFSSSVGGHLSEDDTSCSKRASQPQLETLNNRRLSPTLFPEQRANMYEYNGGMNGQEEIAPMFEADGENIDGSRTLTETTNKLRESNGGIVWYRRNGQNMDALPEMLQKSTDNTRAMFSQGEHATGGLLGKDTSEETSPDMTSADGTITPATSTGSQVTPSQPVSSVVAPAPVLPTTGAKPTLPPLSVKPVKEECK